jgi:transcriptional regulator with XRE-family HTH domain
MEVSSCITPEPEIDASMNKNKPVSDDLFYNDLGHAIRLARQVVGKSQIDVAEHLDVTFQQVQKYENGRNRIPIDRLVSLSKYLDVPLERFLTFTDLSTNGEDDRHGVLKGLNRQDAQLLSFWNTVTDSKSRTIVLNLLKHLAAA